MLQFALVYITYYMFNKNCLVTKILYSRDTDIDIKFDV